MAKKLNKVDAVVIGVGWAGSLVAKELTKAGFQVVGLERGADRDPKDYLHTHDELRYNLRGKLLQDLTKQTYTVRNTMKDTARPVRTKGLVVLGEGPGGSGNHWAGQTQRYYSYDFEIRSKTIERYGEQKIPKDMLIQDWGITYDEIEPYYDKIEKTMAVSGEPEPLGDNRSNPYPTPVLRDTPAMKLYKEAATKLGFHPFTLPGAIATESYTNPDGAQYAPCQYCSFCNGNACEYGAKADPARHVLPIAKETGKFELRTHSHVRRILYTGNKATGVLYIDTQTGEEYEQPAEIVILTTFTINNARLLLLSGIGKPYNPVDQTGIIGKNFTDHHYFNSPTGFFENQKFNLYVGTGQLGTAITDFSGDNFDHSNVNFIHGGQIEYRQFGNLPMADGKYPFADNKVPSGTPTWGREFKKNSLHYTHRTLSFQTQQAIMPNKFNYMDLDPTYKDEYGDPLIRLTFDVHDNEKNINAFLMPKGVEILKEMGADIIENPVAPEHPFNMFLALHNGGGVIMGAEPETSAVNTYLQMWEIDNLFVCGASAFPHFGATNPTLTLSALTYRATEGMIKYLKDGGGLLV